MSVTQEDLLSISSSFSRIIKRGMGKGPESCYSELSDHRLFIYIRNFMTAAEEILTDNQNHNLVMKYRSTVISALSNELLQEAAKLLGIPFTSIYQDWNFQTNAGILLLADDRVHSEVWLDEGFEKKIFQTIQMVGSELHKIPNELRVVKFTQNTCVIECMGAMLPLEYLLLEQGNTDLLLTHSLEIKKGYTQHLALFEEVFQTRIKDLFMMWDCKDNKCYLVFSFNKVNT